MTTNPPSLATQPISDATRTAIDALNACGKSFDASGAITFKPKGNAVGMVEPLIRTGLAELGMACGSRGFPILSRRAADALKPHGLDISDAYDINAAKGKEQSIRF